MANVENVCHLMEIAESCVVHNLYGHSKALIRMETLNVDSKARI